MDSTLEALQKTAQAINSDWSRLPKPGERFVGLSRSTLTELTVPCEANGFRPPVKSAVIKKRHALRGIRLINVPSLMSHLESLAQVEVSR